jgi:hypothetical protein
MTLSSVEKLGAGCSMSFSSDGGTTYKELVNALTIGDSGSEGEFVQTTPIRNTTHTYIPGMQTPPQTSATFNHQPGLTDYKAFIDAAKARQTVKIKKTYTTGDECVFDAALNGYKVNEPEGNGTVKSTVSWQQSGDETWSTTAP